MTRSVVALLIATLAAPLLVAAPVAAGTVAPDAHTALRPIVFPIVGPTSYSDTFGACRSGCSRGHEGTDLMSPKLTKMVAARDARVTWLKDTATPDGSQGNYVMLRDADGWEYWYIHVNNDSPGTDDGANPPEWMFGPGIERGATVRAGQLVGYLGDSGNAEWTAPHLHFEIHKPDGSVINPYRSLRAAPKLKAPIPASEAPTADDKLVLALAEDFLDRRPDDIALAVDVDRLRRGDVASVVKRYAGSDEWASVLVTGLYRSTLGRSPDAAGLAYWLGVLRSGTAPAEIGAGFYASDEYFRRTGATNRAWVADLYEEILGRTADEGGLDYWDQLAEAGTTRLSIAQGFYDSIESRRGRVLALYRSLLRRSPDDGGLAYWADVLTNGRDIELAAYLASSPEYARRAASRAFANDPNRGT